MSARNKDYSHILGVKFGKLIPIKIFRGDSGNSEATCICECGKEKSILVNKILSRHTKSCGCLAGRKQLKDQKFGMLTAIEFLYIDPASKGSVWKFLCECGNMIEQRSSDIIKGTTISCGCFRKTKLLKNIEGQRFGRLIAIKRVQQVRREWKWLAKCDCGNEITTLISALTSGNTNSCGCYHKDQTSDLCYKGPLHSLITQLYGKYRSSAKKRGHLFIITRDYFESIIFQDCHYCGRKPQSYENSAKDKRRKEKLYYNGIDRKDNNVGYIVENCLPSCFNCNAAKRDKTYEEFIEYLKTIAKKWGNL